MLKLTAYAVLVMGCFNAAAQKPVPATLWYQVGHVELAATTSAGDLAATWQFDRADNGDMRIIKDEQRGTGKIKGAVLSICDDQAVIFKDIVPAIRHELQERDDPIMYLQVVLRLLGRALPEGPSSVTVNKKLDVADDKAPLRVRKGDSAQLEFGAPWRAQGSANPGGQGQIRFELAFNYADKARGGARSELKLSGIWQQLSRLRALDNKFSLAGWQVHRIDTLANIVGGNTTLSTVAHTQALQFATVGDLRSRIERWWSTDAGAPKKAQCLL